MSIFSKPNKIYCRVDGEKIKLEVFSKPPRHWDILELRKNNDCYSIVSVYSRDNIYSKAKGELIWEYDSQAVLLQAANSKPRQITSGTMPQEAREELATQTVDNINPLDVNVNTSNNNNPKKSDSGLRKGATAKENLTVDGDMAVDAENLVPVAALDGSASRSRKIMDFIDRAVDGEDYDNLLDLVYRDHADEINALAAAYRRNPANNIANQRYLAEEFLANCADAKVKPSWWKELIAQIRAWLRKRFPSLQFTQKDIEGVLSMAARRVRKGTVRNSRTVDGDMAADEKNSTDAKSSGDLSHSFPDYRGLPSDEQSLAGAALQSVKFSFNISRQSNIVKDAILKISKILQDIENGKHISAKSFITTMQTAGFNRSHEGGSAYLQIDDKSTARLSNHPATASTFVTIGEKANNISIVLRSSATGNKQFISDDSVNLLELQFGRQYLDKGKLPILLADIAHFLATGDYIDNVGALNFELSGNQDFKEKVLNKLYIAAIYRGDEQTALTVENIAFSIGAKLDGVDLSDLSDGADKSDGMRFSVSPVYTGLAAAITKENSGEIAIFGANKKNCLKTLITGTPIVPMEWF